jgi:Na+/melibiose symporter-like transporter
MAYIISFMFYQSLVATMIGSVPYVAIYVLKVTLNDVMLIMAALLVGLFISMPIWGKIANIMNNDRKTIIIASTFLTIVTIPLFFINDYTILLIAMFIWGIGEGGYWVMLAPVFSIMIDESVVMTGRRKEGIYNGFQTFVSRGALVFQALSFSIVHTLTGFLEGSSTQTPEAVMGIQIHFALLPMIFMLIATIILWKFFKLTPNRVKENKEKLAEMRL